LVKPDDEDDMDAEREELFGSSVGPQDGGVGDGTRADAAGQAAAAGRRRGTRADHRRRCLHDPEHVWQQEEEEVHFSGLGTL